MNQAHLSVRLFLPLLQRDVTEDDVRRTYEEKCRELEATRRESEQGKRLTVEANNLRAALMIFDNPAALDAWRTLRDARAQAVRITDEEIIEAIEKDKCTHAQLRRVVGDWLTFESQALRVLRSYFSS